MFKLALISLFALAVSGNPFAESGGKGWIHRRLTASPNFKALPWRDVVKSVVPQKPKYPSGTVRVDGCGTAPALINSTKIVGGVEATPHEFPWQVAVLVNSRYFCGGQVISKDWVLTAAHCLEKAKSVDMVFGAHDIKYQEDTTELLTSNTFIRHEGWDPETMQNDIALIGIPYPLNFNDYIQPVCLPKGDDLGAGVIVTPTGWGIESDSKRISTYLRKVDVPTITNEDCAKYYGDLITEDMLCTDSSGSKGSCLGDSGGPLNHVIAEGVTETRGVTSFEPDEGCESGGPDSFTRITHYLGWIQDQTGISVF